MAEIRPFAAYRYDPSRVRLADVLTQPYDKITPSMQEQYANRSPYNLVVVEKGQARPGDSPQNNVYTRAARALKDWMQAAVLVRDPAPSMYAYSQEYEVPGSRARVVRKGFIALSRVEDYSAGVVFRHEQTHAGPKADRLELLRRTRVHTGQLFMLYSDPTRRIETLVDQASRTAPPVDVRDEYDVVHRISPVSDPQVIREIQAGMADKKLIIADGHHRYETALAYRDETRTAVGAADRDAPHEWVMMTFVDTHSEGLTILPTHRLIANLRQFEFETFRKRLEPHFDCLAFSNGGGRVARYTEFRRELVARGRERPAIGVYAGAGAYYLFTLLPKADLAALLPDLSPSQRQLDVVLLHRLLLEKGLGVSAEAVVKEQNLSYERDMDAAIGAVDAGRARLCCLLNPVRIEQVCESAMAGHVLPQKSTDFYPKLLSGLAIFRLDG